MAPQHILFDYVGRPVFRSCFLPPIQSMRVEMIRTLIVDDTPLVRQGIRLLLHKEPDVEIVGEAADGLEAVATIKALRPDLLFLDVQMPGLNGFEVLQQVGREHLAVIFITAFNQYAMRAFEADAISYLLKPVAPERFHLAFERARCLLQRPEEMRSEFSRIAEIILCNKHPAQRSSQSNRFLVRKGDSFVFLKPSQVDWVSSAGEYATLHTQHGMYDIRTTISQLEERLPPSQFVRIHRSTIVNLDRIKEVRPLEHGDCEVMLHDGVSLRLSRSYRYRVF
jgi:two-component system, LytTR family, response regulator